MRRVSETRFVEAPDGKRLPFEDAFTRCDTCGAELYLHGQSLEVSRNRAAALRAHGGLLTPEQIRGIREKFGLTQARLEELLGTGAKTVVRWERGSVCQSQAADKLLRLLQRRGPSLLEPIDESGDASEVFPVTADTAQELFDAFFVDAAARFSGEWPIPLEIGELSANLMASRFGWQEGWAPHGGIMITGLLPPDLAAHSATDTRAAHEAARIA